MTTLRGKCSWFGGPNDTGVSPSEGLAFIYDVDDAPYLFLPAQPPGTTGLARRLDSNNVHFIACRWNYDETSKEDLLHMVVTVHAPSTGRTYKAFPADWGPNTNTGRVADLSHALLMDLGIETDDEVEVTFTPPGEETMIYYESIVISSGHSTKCQGAVGIINEVAEATKVVDRVVDELRKRGVQVKGYHDTKSTSSGANLNAIVGYHNAQQRQLDVSVHFNASESHEGHGVEVLWLTQEALAREVSAAIAKAGGLTDRGPKFRDNLKFLNDTEMPSILIETCFVDHQGDVDRYRAEFDHICSAIADTLGGPLQEVVEPPVEPATDVVEISIAAPNGVKLRIILDGSVVLDESKV